MLNSNLRSHPRAAVSGAVQASSSSQSAPTSLTKAQKQQQRDTFIRDLTMRRVSHCPQFVAQLSGITQKDSQASHFFSGNRSTFGPITRDFCHGLERLMNYLPFDAFDLCATDKRDLEDAIYQLKGLQAIHNIIVPMQDTIEVTDQKINVRQWITEVADKVDNEAVAYIVRQLRQGPCLFPLIVPSHAMLMQITPETGSANTNAAIKLYNSGFGLDFHARKVFRLQDDDGSLRLKVHYNTTRQFDQAALDLDGGGADKKEINPDTLKKLLGYEHPLTHCDPDEYLAAISPRVREAFLQFLVGSGASYSGTYELLNVQGGFMQKIVALAGCVMGNYCLHLARQTFDLKDKMFVERKCNGKYIISEIYRWLEEVGQVRESEGQKRDKTFQVQQKNHDCITESVFAYLKDVLSPEMYKLAKWFLLKEAEATLPQINFINDSDRQSARARLHERAGSAYRGFEAVLDAKQLCQKTTKKINPVTGRVKIDGLVSQDEGLRFRSHVSRQRLYLEDVKNMSVD